MRPICFKRELLSSGKKYRTAYAICYRIIEYGNYKPVGICICTDQTCRIIIATTFSDYFENTKNISCPIIAHLKVYLHSECDKGKKSFNVQLLAINLCKNKINHTR